MSSAVTASAAATTEQVLYVSFNQDFSCINVGTTLGFKVFSMDGDQKQRCHRNFGAGIGIVEVLYCSNILVLVGGDPNPHWPKNKLIIWDDRQNTAVAELEFTAAVKGVKFCRERIFVCLEKKVYLYALRELQLIKEFAVTNPNGVCSMGQNNVATLGLNIGSVNIQQLVEPYETKTINAHETIVACLALNADGGLLATASEKGTLVRLWDTNSCAKLLELRRGLDRVNIYSLNFSPYKPLLVVTSDKGTCHIFADKNNVQSSLASINFMLPGYFSSQWSPVHFDTTTIKNCACFGPDDSVIVVDKTGDYFKYSLTLGKDGYVAKKLVRKNILGKP